MHGKKCSSGRRLRGDPIPSCFLTVCLNPTLQKTIVLKNFAENEVNRSGEHYLDASGKGINVSRVLTQLGEKVIHLTQTGGVNKARFLQMAAREGIAVETVESNSEIRYCYTLIDTTRRTTTEIVEESEKAGSGTEAKVLKKFLSLLRGCHAVIISGTKAAGFSDALYPLMVRAAKEAGKTVVLDFRGNDLKNSLIYGPDVIKPNFFEFCSAFLPGKARSEHHNDEKTVRLVANTMIELHERYGTTPVVTHGSHDILYLDNGKIRRLRAKRLVPVNTIGCGDAFAAGFASALRAGESMTRCVEKGRKCAALNAVRLRPGTIEGA